MWSPNPPQISNTGFSEEISGTTSRTQRCRYATVISFFTKLVSLIAKRAAKGRFVSGLISVNICPLSHTVGVNYVHASTKKSGR